MKNILKSITAGVLLLAAIGINAQENIELIKVHPDIAKYTELYKLNQEQVQELTKIYSETTEKGREVEEQMKRTQLQHRETIKSATPSERQKMKSEMDGLAQERQKIKTEREQRMISILDQEQLAIHKQKQAKKNSPLKKEAVKSPK
ncbi:MAG: hypothetical protein HKO93_07745 [Flavobacteriales bacterium]|nr:hypothetical protein [Flavobacteriales bacterium]